MEKDFSIVVFLMMATLLSFSSVSCLSILPRVTRTNDAIIIDFADDENAALYQGKNFNPYTTMQQTKDSNGWSYFYGYPMTSLEVPSSRQSAAHWRHQQPSGKQAIPCGRGPPTMPAKRSLLNERIASGTNAKKNIWPFMVALKKADGIFCGGTLINTAKVILAAQCLEKMSTFEISSVTVLVGMHKGDQSDVQMTRRISQVVIHSQYNAATFANDIAIITLDAPVIFSRSVGPVCLPAANSDPDQFVDQDAIIMGWGGTGGLGSSGPVDVPIVGVSGPSTGTVGGSGTGTKPGKPVSGPGAGIAAGGTGGINKPSTETGTTSGSSSVSGSGTGGANRPGTSTATGPGSSSATGPAHGSGSGASTPSGPGSSSATGPGSSTATGPTHGSGSGASTPSGPAHGSGSGASAPSGPAHGSGSGASTPSGPAHGSGSGASTPSGPAHGSGSGTSSPSGSGSSSATGPGSSTATGPESPTATGPVSPTATSPGSPTATGPGSSSATGPGSSTATSPGSSTATGPGSPTAPGPGSSSATGPAHGSGSGASTPTDPIHVSAPGTVIVNGPGTVIVSGPSSGTVTGPTNAGGPGTSTPTDPTHVTGPGSVIVSGPGTVTGPTNAGGSGTSTVIDSGNKPVSAGPSTGPENVSVPPTSASSPSYGGTLINIGGITIISGKDDHSPAATSRTAPNALLQQAKVAIMSNADCRADPVIGKFVTDRTICITSPDKFTCQGDVGGPIVVMSSPGTWTLAAINSYTKDCNTNGLKTSVSAYKAWIDLYTS